MFTLQDILLRGAIDPCDVNVMLHSPRAGDLLRHLPGLVQTRRQAMEVYQATHSKPAERALSQGRPWVASFVKTGAGHQPGTSAMLFAGLYRNPGPRQAHRHEIEANPEVRWLHETFGAFTQIEDPGWTSWAWFDLALDDRLAELQGRLVIETRLTRAYVRLAEKIEASVLAIHPESRFDEAPPSWRDMVLNAGILQALPDSWAGCLRQWRGVYLIVDESDGMRYVGSAYGEDNLLGRWREHVSGDAGITAALAKRDPRKFRFSILELTSPSAGAEDVIEIENSWKTRLHSRKFGLNEN